MRAKLEKATVDKPAKIKVDRDELIGAIVVDDLVDPETGEVIAAANTRVTEELLAQADEAGLNKLALAFPDWDPDGEILHQTLEKDTSTTQMDARMEIYRRQRPGDPPTEESATTLFNGLFFDERKYDLSQVGRFKFNAKLALDKELERRILDVEDFLHLVRYLLLSAPRPRSGRRHRFVGQSARPHRRRADGEPVPHRSGADGAGDQGEDVHPSRTSTRPCPAIWSTPNR